jgi:hypothetical protein
MDFIGVAMIMGAIVAFTLAFQYGGQERSWNNSAVIGLLVAFPLILIAFGIWEYWQGERALLVPRLLAHKQVGISCLYTFLFGGSYFLIIYYLPIYFQSVDDVSPLMSGVYNLPLILSVTISMILSGIFISKTGLAVPTEIAGSAFALVGYGLLYTLNINTSTGKWIGYQILSGVGAGLAFQVPIIVAQSGADAEDISSITAMVLFFQCMGGTTMLVAAQSAFANKLIATVRISALGIDPLEVVQTGATQIRSTFRADQVPGVVLAYMTGIKTALAISVAATGVAFLASLCNRWKRIHAAAGEVAV